MCASFLLIVIGKKLYLNSCVKLGAGFNEIYEREVCANISRKPCTLVFCQNLLLYKGKISNGKTVLDLEVVKGSMIHQLNDGLAMYCETKKIQFLDRKILDGRYPCALYYTLASVPAIDTAAVGAALVTAIEKWFTYAKSTSVDRVVLFDSCLTIRTS